MDPSSLITWAICVGVAWVIFVGLTGADDWLKSLFGKPRPRDLESRIEKLEARLADLEKNKSGTA